MMRVYLLNFTVFLLLCISGIVSSEAESDLPQQNKKNSRSPQSIKRKPSVNYGILEKDFYKPIESELITRKASPHLKIIEQICTSKGSVSEKAIQLENALQELRAVAEQYLDNDQYNLRSRDESFLRGVRYHFQQERLSYGQPLTENLLQTSDVRIPFEINYRMYYRLPENTSFEKFPDEWARQFYKSLNCLYGSL